MTSSPDPGDLARQFGREASAQPEGPRLQGVGALHTLFERFEQLGRSDLFSLEKTAVEKERVTREVLHELHNANYVARDLEEFLLDTPEKPDLELFAEEAVVTLAERWSEVRLDFRELPFLLMLNYARLSASDNVFITGYLSKTEVACSDLVECRPAQDPSDNVLGIYHISKGFTWGAP